MLDERLDEGPVAVVLRLLLRPDDLLQMGHLPETLDERIGRERIELLDADDGGVLVARLVARFDQVVGDLAREEDGDLDGLVRLRRRIGKGERDGTGAGEVPGARTGPGRKLGG